MFTRHCVLALALHLLAGTAVAEGLEKRSKVTLTRTVTRTATKPQITAITTDGSTIPVTSEAAVETTTIDGETVIVQTTITSPCTECAESSEVSTQAESSADAETTSLASSEGPESTPVITTTITQACTECLGGTTVIVSTLTSTDLFTSTGIVASNTLSLGSTASSALAETTSGSVSDATASETVPIGSETVSSSIILTTGYTLSTISSASGIYTNTTTAIPGTTAISEVSSSDIAITSNILSTGGSSIISVSPSSSLLTNTTVIVPGTTVSEASSTIIDISTATDATGITAEPTGGEFITRTVTRDGSIQVTTATVTATVGQPVIIIIQQITLFIFTSNLGSTCPVVTPGSNGGFVVDGEGHDDIGSACRTACYKQFATCTTNAGTNFRVKDCQTQLGACMKAASTQTITRSPVTLTQTVVLPPNCPTQAVSEGVSIISSKTLTGGEVATIGTGGVSVITRTGTFTVSETSAASSADATGIPETVSHVKTTEGVTVTQIDESGSAHISVVTMTLTIPEGSASGSQTIEVGSTVTSDVSTVTLLPSGTRTTTEISIIKSTYTIPAESISGTSVGSSAIGSETTSFGATQTVGTGLASTSLVTMSLPPVDGTGTGQTTVVTMTISNGGGPSGSGTGIPTSLPGTAVTSETAVGSITEVQSSAEATATHSIHISTNVVTVTIGTQTGVITLTQTGTPITETVTITGQCGGGKVTAVTKTETVIETTCPVSTAPATTTLATSTQDPNETAYVTVTVDPALRAAASRAAASEAALIQRVRRGFGGW